MFLMLESGEALDRGAGASLEVGRMFNDAARPMMRG
jgi:hypothetical protein